MPNYSRYKSSITNNTRVFSIMNGLAPRSTVGKGITRATKKLVIPADPEDGLEYMKKYNILSTNPACSGGVGRINNTSCTSKDGLLMSVAPRNYQYQPLYNHIYKRDDPSTHHLPCTYRGGSGVTVGKISNQGFDSSGNAEVTENIFMCNVPAVSHQDSCYTEDVYAFYDYSWYKPFYNNIKTECGPRNWDNIITNCFSRYECSTQTMKPWRIVVDDAIGFIGILAIISINEILKPINFKGIDLSGEWEIPEISMNIYYPTTSLDSEESIFTILPGAHITNKADITFINDDVVMSSNVLSTTLFDIQGRFSNYGKIKYKNKIVAGINMKLFHVHNDPGHSDATFINMGEINIPNISTTDNAINIVTLENNALFFNSGIFKVTSITSESLKNSILVNILTDSQFINDQDASIDFNKLNIKKGTQLVTYFNVINKSTFTNRGTINTENISAETTNNFRILQLSGQDSTFTNEDTGKMNITSPSINNVTTTTDLFLIGSGGGGNFINSGEITFTLPIGDANSDMQGFSVLLQSYFTNIGDIKINQMNDFFGKFTLVSLINAGALNDASGTINVNPSDGVNFCLVQVDGTSFINKGRVFIAGLTYNASEDSHIFHIFNYGNLFNHGLIQVESITVNTNITIHGFYVEKNAYFKNTGMVQILSIEGTNNGIINLATFNSGSTGVNDVSGIININDASGGDIKLFNISSSSFTNQGEIAIPTLENSVVTANTKYGFYIDNSSTLTNENTITFGNIIGNSSGFYIDNSSKLTNENTITFGNIIGNSSGFYIDNSSKLTNENGGKITILNLENTSKGGAFYINKYSELINKDQISLDDIDKKSIGIYLGSSTLTNTSGKIALENITGNSSGFYIDNSSILINNDQITLGGIIGNSNGLYFTDKSTLTNTSGTNTSGKITLGSIAESKGLYLEGGSKIINNYQITLGDITNESNGLYLNGSTLTNTFGTITLGSISESKGLYLEGGSKIINNAQIILGTISQSSGLYFTGESTLTNNTDISFDTIDGGVNELATYGLYRKGTSTIENNGRIIFSEILGNAVGVVAEISSILPHEIMDGHGTINITQFHKNNYQDITNPYTYTFGKRGIALTAALMNNAREFTNPSSSASTSNYCPIAYPYAYIDFQNQIYGWTEKEISNSLEGTLKSKCCSVQPSVSGISHNWSGLNRNGIDYRGYDSAKLSAVRQLATNIPECGGPGYNFPQFAGWTANGAFSFRHVCPEGASYDPGEPPANMQNTLQSMPGIPRAQIFSSKTMYSQKLTYTQQPPNPWTYKRFYSFGYGWKDLDYRETWLYLVDAKITPGTPINTNVYYLSLVNGTPYAKTNEDKTWLIQDFVASADFDCATKCNEKLGCTSYSLIPAAVDGGDSNSPIQYYCLGRSDGYTDYKGVQGWGGVISSTSQGESLSENWDGDEAAATTTVSKMNYHYAQWCDSVDKTEWRPASAAPAPLVGYVGNPPQIAPTINFNGSVNISDGGGPVGSWEQYDAFITHPSNGIEKWCDATTADRFVKFTEMTTTNAKQQETRCLDGETLISTPGCWDPDPDFGGCYTPSDRNDGGVLSLEKMPAELFPNQNGDNGANVQNSADQGGDGRPSDNAWPPSDAADYKGDTVTDPPPNTWLMNIQHFQIPPVPPTDCPRCPAD